MSVYFLDNRYYLYDESNNRFLQLDAKFDGRRVDAVSDSEYWPDIGELVDRAIGDIGTGITAAASELKVDSRHVTVGGTKHAHTVSGLFDEFASGWRKDKAEDDGGGVIESARRVDGEWGRASASTSVSMPSRSRLKRSNSLLSIPTEDFRRSSSPTADAAAATFPPPPASEADESDEDANAVAIHQAGVAHLQALSEHGVNPRLDDVQSAINVPTALYADRSLSKADGETMKKLAEAEPTIRIDEPLIAGRGLDADQQVETSRADVEDGAVHLQNCYQTNVGPGLIRSGVINTRQRAQDLHEVILDSIDPGRTPGKTPRVVSCSLLSKATQKELIENQHAQVARLNQEARPERQSGGTGQATYQVVHMNLQASAAVYWCRLRPFSTMVTGENYSAKLNVEAMARYVLWFLEDADLPPGTVERPSVYALHLLQENSISSRDTTLDSDDRKLARDGIPPHRATLTRQLKSIYEQLGTVDGMTARLLRAFIGAQLRKEKMSRGQEAMILACLNRRLGVTFAMNCDTGLDRTGWMHALNCAQIQMGKMDVDEDELAMIALEWDQQTESVNARLQEVDADNYNDQIEGAVRDLTPYEERVMKFRRLFLLNLMEVGMPAAHNGGGTVGVNWGEDWAGRSRVPINFLPAFAQDDDGTIRRLTEPARWGARLTDDGKSLILGHYTSRFR